MIQHHEPHADNCHYPKYGIYHQHTTLVKGLTDDTKKKNKLGISQYVVSIGFAIFDNERNILEIMVEIRLFFICFHSLIPH